ncbi:MAG: hypothetical protein KKD63_00575 [Proteobacteria bacterium]|nr:response regulator [Desulfobulbaceae bacterium]MBU4151352.1 hypothetical protein [Pseudomonadota bacterium]MDP2106781.1 hypothetical protein [Desulfobulbaceae bacterium]
MNKSSLQGEDSADNVLLPLRALKTHNISSPVTVLRDGPKALDYLSTTGNYSGHTIPLPAIVLLDLNLPKINGIEAIHQLESY